MSTRIIGAIIMTHGDDNGFGPASRGGPHPGGHRPHRPAQGGRFDKAEELRKRLSAICRVKCDASDNSPGWKFAQYEMKGVPCGWRIGPTDIENNQCVPGPPGQLGKTIVPWISWRRKSPSF